MIAILKEVEIMEKVVTRTLAKLIGKLDAALPGTLMGLTFAGTNVRDFREFCSNSRN